MKALYIYNPNSANEISLIDRAKSEMTTYIDIISVNDIPDMLKKYVRTTPALIIINDDLQGDGLLAEGTDGKLLATAMIYKRLDEEEQAIHNQNNERLDSMINTEIKKAITPLQDQLLLAQNQIVEGGIF